MDVQFLVNVIQKSIEICEQNVSLLKILKIKCNEQDVQFIVEKCETLRSNEKLISLNRSILEETVSMVDKSSDRLIESALVSTEGARASTEGTRASTDNADNLETMNAAGSQVHEFAEEEEIEQRNVEKFVNLAEQRVSFKETVTLVHYSNGMDEMSTDKTSSVPSAASPKINSSVNPSTGADEEEIEQKYRPNDHGTQFYVEKFVNLAEQRVSFKQAVTVVHFSTDADDAPNQFSSKPSSSEPSSKSSAGESSSKPSKETKKKSSPKRNSLQLAYVQQIRDGKLDFQRNLKRTVGLCFFCDERKSFTKLQWQKHLLRHTNENLYICKQCGYTSAKRHRHSSCVPAQMTDIFEQYQCIGENCLAAFMCNVCNYVKVDENGMVQHLTTNHRIKENYDQSYRKCNFVTNV